MLQVTKSGAGTDSILKIPKGWHYYRTNDCIRHNPEGMTLSVLKIIL